MGQYRVIFVGFGEEFFEKAATSAIDGRLRAWRISDKSSVKPAKLVVL